MPEDQFATLIGGIQPVEEGCAGTTNMEVACWGRCKAYSNLFKHSIDERRVHILGPVCKYTGSRVQPNMTVGRCVIYTAMRTLSVSRCGSTWSGRGGLTPSEVVLGLSTAATAEQWRLHRCLNVCKDQTFSAGLFLCCKAVETGCENQAAPLLLCSAPVSFCNETARYASFFPNVQIEERTRAFQGLLLYSGRMRSTS